MKTTTIAMLQNLYSIPLPLLFDREMEPHKLTIYYESVFNQAESYIF